MTLRIALLLLLIASCAPAAPTPEASPGARPSAATVVSTKCSAFESTLEVARGLAKEGKLLRAELELAKMERGCDPAIEALAAELETKLGRKEKATLALASEALERAKGKEGADRTAALDRVFALLERVSRKKGRAVILRPTPPGPPVLLPGGHAAEVVAIGKAGLRLRGKRLEQVGERAIALEGGKLVVHGPDPVEIEGSFDSVEVPHGSNRYVLARKSDRAFVIDTESGKTVLEVLAKHAQLMHQSDGSVRLLGQSSGDKVALFAIPGGEAVIELAPIEQSVALDPLARRMAISTLERVVLRDTVDGREVGSVRLPLLVSNRASFSRDGQRLVVSAMSRAPGVFLDYLLLDFANGTHRKVGSTRGIESGEILFTRDGKHVCANPPSVPIPAVPFRAGHVGRCVGHRAADGHHDAVVVSVPVAPGWRIVERDLITHVAGAEVAAPDGSTAAFVQEKATGARLPMRPALMKAVVVNLAQNETVATLDLGALAPVEVDEQLQYSGDGRFLRAGDSTLDLLLRQPAAPFISLQSPKPVQHGYKVGGDGRSLVLVTPAGERAAIAFWSAAPLASAAILDDGRFDPMTSAPSDMACAFDDVLAPIEVCADQYRLPEGTVQGWLESQR